MPNLSKSRKLLQRPLNAVVASALILLALPAAFAAEDIIARLKRQCDDGLASACFDYGTYLADIGKSLESSQFVRRACRMGYADACGERRAIAEEPNVKVGEGCLTPEIAEAAMASVSEKGLITKVDEGSIWAKAGFKAGDRISKADGRKIATSNDLVDAFKAGLKQLEIVRGGKREEIAIRCP